MHSPGTSTRSGRRQPWRRTVQEEWPNSTRGVAEFGQIGAFKSASAEGASNSLLWFDLKQKAGADGVAQA